MPVSTTLKRSVAVTGLVGAAALIAPALASAQTTFDSPAPTTLLCQSGLEGGTVFADVHKDNAKIDYGDVLYGISAR